MRQAILKRAFEGKLVPQDLDNEPAGLLLERICAERAKGTGGTAIPGCAPFPEQWPRQVHKLAKAPKEAT